MTTLVALLTSGYLPHVQKLADDEQWDKVVLVTNNQGKAQFQCSKQVEFVVINDNWNVSDMATAMTKGLEKEYGEIGLNFVSGTGKEHMALLAAVMKAGLSFRLVAVTKEGIAEL